MAARGVEGRRRAALARSLIVALGCAALIACVPTSAGAATCTDEFTGPSGGSWASAANWSAGLPAAGTVVCWSTTSTVVVDEGAQQAASISSGGSLLVKGGSLDLADQAARSSLHGEVTTGENGLLRLAGGLECAGAKAEGGTLQDDGAIGCVLTLLGGGRLTGAGTVATLSNVGGVVEAGNEIAPGDLRVAGEYAQGSAGTLIARAQTPNAVGADALDVAGSLRLAGTISLQLGFSGASGESVPVIRSAGPPQGAFASMLGSTGGTPWTVEYGQAGVIAIDAAAPLLHPVISGRPEVGTTIGCGLGEWTPDPGTVAYRWTEPVRFVGTSTEKVPGYFEAPPPEEELISALNNATGPQLLVPGAAIGTEIACSTHAKIPVAGSSTVTSVDEWAQSLFVTVTSELVNRRPPQIVGIPAPGQTLRCTFGEWNGTIAGFAYRWSGGASKNTTDEYRVTKADEGKQLVCTVYVRHKAAAIPASSRALEIPPRPQPTLCPRRPLALVSVRPAGRQMLLFGAASQSYIGASVTALGPHGRATSRVGPSGYIEIALPRRGSGAGAYALSLGFARSNSLRLPGVLQIVSDSSKPGESQVVLRLAHSASRPAELAVLRLRGCKVLETTARDRIAPGETRSLSLTARRGQGPVPYLARVRISGRIYSVELIVPPRPVLRFLP